jgi:uncharacterized protein
VSRPAEGTGVVERACYDVVVQQRASSPEPGTAQTGAERLEPARTVADRLAELEASFERMGSVLVCYSGGTDSALLLAVATRVLGSRAIGMTAASPSLPPSELAAARALAAELGAEHRVVESRELQSEAYAANRPDRCFHCKSELYRIAEQQRRAWGLAAIVNGANVDDRGDYRPGLQAAARFGVHSPLLELGFTKALVRQVSRSLGLPTWNKPAAACLASRIPYGTAITAGLLEQIADFEAAIRGCGFEQVRVRYHGAVARIELGLGELARAAEPSVRAELVEAGHRFGFRYVTLDLAGYRQGSHNEVLSEAERRDPGAQGR